MWYRFLSNKKELQPKTAIAALSICDKDFYPNVFKLLQIFATLPVSTSSTERSFSTLRRIKTYLRNSTSEQRLNGLAMLNIHRDISISTNEIIDLLAKRPRRLDFVL